MSKLADEEAVKGIVLEEDLGKGVSDEKEQRLITRIAAALRAAKADEYRRGFNDGVDAAKQAIRDEPDTGDEDGYFKATFINAIARRVNLP